MVEDDAFCTKTLTNPSAPAMLAWDNGIKWLMGQGWKVITATYFAKAGEKLSVNSISGPFQITLPLNPSQFDEIVMADHFQTWETNNVTLLRNGSLIENLADDLVLNTPAVRQITLRYEGSTWRVY